MINYLRLLLLPFSVLYGIVVIIRNMMYDLGLFKSVEFDLPVICAGNIAVGGSGKTPVTEYLLHLLKDKKIAILSRGYGRRTKGFIIAGHTATAETIGDEPMQFFRKFPQVTVAVCEDRVKGIKQLKDDHDLIILDDAFQHRAVKPGLSILLFEYQKLLKPQFLLPAGNMREPFNGYKRADLILITKAPSTLQHNQKEVCLDHFPGERRKDVTFSFLEYADLHHLYTAETRTMDQIKQDTEIFLLSGIANPGPLLEHLYKYTANVHHFDYPDHYSFKPGDITRLIEKFNKQNTGAKLIITTEKDMQRLSGRTFRELLLNLPVFYLPVKIAISQEDKVNFDQKILNYVAGIT